MTQQANASAAGGQAGQPPRVPKRIAAVIINSLKGGVVPRVGLPYITVGREREIQALLHDLDLVADGGASFRFLVGRYGSGKSFLLQTIRNHAMGSGFVVCDADLSPERRLQGGNGQGLATYRELVRNMSTRTRPEGGALNLVLDRWVSNMQAQVTLERGLQPQDPGFSDAMDAAIVQTMRSLQELVHGYDFARLLTMYWHAHVEGDDDTKAKVTKWFRGEYRNKTEARQELGVNIVIGDDDWYDYLKLFATFLVGAGYKGLLVLVDELVNLYKIPNAVSRQYNYEKILTMYNDTLQGKAHHLGIVMGGTPQSIEDRRRGLYSYEALRSRLTQGRFAQDGLGGPPGAGHPPAAPHARGAAGAGGEARGHPRRALWLRAHHHAGRAGWLSPGRVRPRGGRLPPDPARGHTRLCGDARHPVPEPLPQGGRPAAGRAPLVSRDHTRPGGRQLGREGRRVQRVPDLGGGHGRL
jgi:hypothetical protein